MKQVKQNNTLYVLDTEAYAITEDTDVSIIYVPEDSYSDYVQLNPTLDLTRYNYRTIRITNDIEYFNPIEDRYLTVEAITDCTVNFTKLGNEDKIIYYSDDWGDTWNPLETDVTVSAGNGIVFKSNLQPINDTVNKLYGIGTFTISGSCNVSGNPLSMIEEDEFKGIKKLTLINSFRSLFKNCTGLVSAKDLSLKFKVLANNCYQAMFSGCTSLIETPELLATTLAKSCYGSMFYNCTSLTKAPKLLITTLSDQCYNYMFYGCTGLTTAPELPATTLTSYCYYGMFWGCTSLTKTPKLPATIIAANCYGSMFEDCTNLIDIPSILPATTLADGCYDKMFSGCTSLTTAPELPATTLAYNCYNWMFTGCSNLTKAPELPAPILVEACYRAMFNGCTKLNNIICLATDISAKNCLMNWVYNVAASGTFKKAEGVESWTTGNNGIPSGWTVEEI